jgi:hypothetical protein
MLTRVLRTVRLDTIDKRSQVGCALRKLKDELTAQLGGADQVTPALALLIEQFAIKAIIAKAVGEYVLKQDCPVQNDTLVSVVMEHDTIQKTLALLLEKIGLKRRYPEGWREATRLGHTGPGGGPVEHRILWDMGPPPIPVPAVPSANGDDEDGRHG